MVVKYIEDYLGEQLVLSLRWLGYTDSRKSSMRLSKLVRINQSTRVSMWGRPDDVKGLLNPGR
jgi:hypothetical protein